MICPFCGATAVESPGNITYGYVCACGGRALGAPPWDFDEVIDDAIAELQLHAHAAAINFVPPERWLDELGVAFQRGPVVDRVHFYWFKRVGKPQRPDPATQADLDRILELAGRAWNHQDEIPAIVAELQTIRALGAGRPQIVEACDNALKMISGLSG